MDTWWNSFVDSQPVVGIDETTRALDSRWFADLGANLDPWFAALSEAYSLPEFNQETATLDRRWQGDSWATIETCAPALTETYSSTVLNSETVTLFDYPDGDRWRELDSWWNVYEDVSTENARELRTVLEQSNDIWAASKSRFDADPLATNWTAHSNTRGPLRPNQEENWSQWLAHLLRGSDGVLLGELFGDSYDSVPESVEREVYLPDTDAPDRYADILVFDDNRGISIEVKKGDEHYGKTTHTAGLVEEHFAHDWTHTLLVPEFKRPALHSAFDDAIETGTDGQSEIQSDQSGPISVLFWREISEAIRRAILNETTVSPHWEASAYLFCTLVEQKLLGFNPQQDIISIVTADNFVHATPSLTVATGSVEKQLNYLKKTVHRNEQ